MSVFAGIILWKTRLSRRRVDARKEQRGALDFRSHPAQEHQTEHAKVATERPEGMGEGCRAVPLEGEVPHPGQPVSGHGRCRQPGRRYKDAGNYGNTDERGPDEMEDPRPGPHVLRHIERPELLVAAVALLHGAHARSTPVRLQALFDRDSPR